LRGATLDQFDDPVAHLRFDGAQLVLDLDAVLLTEDKEVLALHVQLAGQREDADFFSLQAELPMMIYPDIGLPPDNKTFAGPIAPELPSIQTKSPVMKRASSPPLPPPAETTVPAGLPGPPGLPGLSLTPRPTGGFNSSAPAGEAS